MRLVHLTVHPTASLRRPDKQAPAATAVIAPAMLVKQALTVFSRRPITFNIFKFKKRTSTHCFFHLLFYSFINSGMKLLPPKRSLNDHARRDHRANFHPR